MGYNSSEPRDAHGRWSSGYRDSLEHQLRLKGNTPERARELATEIMTNNGTIDTSGRLTAKGREREKMGRALRRRDNLARQSGHPVSQIGYQHGKAYIK
jgi:hypothetical protein